MPWLSNEGADGLERDGPSVVRISLTRFVVLSLLALGVLEVGLVVASKRVSHGEALQDARLHGHQIADGLAAPMLDAEVRAGDPLALARLDAGLRQRMRDGSVSHIKLWDPDGTVVWSDQTELVGRRFELPEEVSALFGTRGDVTEVSALERTENAEERQEAPLLEVYVGAHDADGEPFVFEAYIPPELIAAQTSSYFGALLPVGFGALLLFQVAVLPLGYALARRVERAERHRSEILSRSLSAWHAERRRLAQDLHDGVIQDLAAAGYALPAVLRMLPAAPEADQARATGDQLEQLLHRDLAALRSLVADLFPIGLAGEGLQTALGELAARSADEGLDVQLRVPPGLEVEPEVAGLVYRVVREGLRNTIRHSGAEAALVTVTAVDDSLCVEVADEGRGLAAQPGDSAGHFGLRLLAEVLRDVGADLDLADRPGGGAVLTARIPTTLRDWPQPPG